MHSIFSYYISKDEVNIAELDTKRVLGDYLVYTDSDTPFNSFVKGERGCALFGYAIDVISGDCDDLTNKILLQTGNLAEVIEYERRLGGKYILLYFDGSGFYVIGDATCSIPVYFGGLAEGFACSCNPNYIARELSLEPDEKLMKIRNLSEISQALPYNVTVYKEIKQLIPNHYLSFSKRADSRFVNSSSKQREIGVEEATKTVAPMIDNLVKYYLNEFDTYCPITSGRDSRVVLAFLAAYANDELKGYTIKHKEHSGAEQDLVIPRLLAEHCSFSYEQIADVDPLDKLVFAVNRILGKGQYSSKTLLIANTVKAYCKGRAIINGDIIGQVGKCSLHRDIPEFLATPRYFRCKMHNYSKESLLYVKKWLKDIKQSGEKVNTFDLFSVENRLGRWAGQENLIYNTISQPYLNVFNSRSIIYTWTAVPRNKRKKSLLHFGLIEVKQPKMMEIPFEKEKKTVFKLSKANGIFYYLSSFAKFYIEKMKFLRNKNEKSDSNCG